MKITVIGTGAIGGNLARRLSEAGHDVLAADARGPEAVAADVLAAGVRAVELDDAVLDRDVVVLSIPFGRQPDLAGLLATAAEGTVVVDTSNYYPDMNGRVEPIDQGQVESLWAQEQLGRPVVKAWNAALAATQQERGLPAGSPDRIAIPVAADSADARQLVMGLVDDTGFDAVDAGPLADSWRQQPGTPAYCTELGAEDLRRALAAAVKDQAPLTRDRLTEHYAGLTAWPSHDEVVATNRAAHRPLAD
ncbi:NADPH-dependent F420 reductase [Aeromicrobium massiliense]|uniref:NADPH-dependent F420 reductase n=1 Tax=Aeromicrobium massiliense TaxID=1464554 RepID=UPI0003169EF7|nr:NAD(P)-binding domain-containing protein [Aeromicrobium massiliense]